jgi:hypothetical protein
MSALASVITPFSFGPAVELANRQWRKKILPIGSIDYQGRQLNFTRDYLSGLVRAFLDRAYDSVPFQLAPGDNSHSNDPERTRGQITDMSLEDDGLYVTARVTSRGEAVLRENPQLGVSARIVEQYSRSDGRFYPAAIQHVLGTLDPRIPGLGQWQPVDMSSSPAMIIDLSSSSWAGEDAAPAAADAELTDAELADLLEVLDDDELEALIQDQDGGNGPALDALGQFNEVFTNRIAVEQAQAQARADADLADLIRPPKTDEDRLARALGRIQAGVYDTPSGLAFAAESRAVELAVTTGAGPCGPPDEFGRCSSRYHDLECSHGTGPDWLAESGAPRATYQASLANLASGYDLSGTVAPVWDDADDPDAVPRAIPAATIELAAALNEHWGLRSDVPSFGWDDLFGEQYLGDPYSELAAQAGLDVPQQPQPSYPGISEIRQQLGL